MCGSFILQTNATQLQSITLIYNFGVGHWTKLTPICNCSPQDHKYLLFAIVPSVSPSRTVFRELPPPILFFLATAKCRYKSIVKGRNFAQTQDNWRRGNTFIDQSIKMRKVLGIIHWVDGLFLWPVKEHLNTSIFEVDFVCRVNHWTFPSKKRTVSCALMGERVNHQQRSWTSPSSQITFRPEIHLRMQPSIHGTSIVKVVPEEPVRKWGFLEWLTVY